MLCSKVHWFYCLKLKKVPLLPLQPYKSGSKSSPGLALLEPLHSQTSLFTFSEHPSAWLPQCLSVLTPCPLLGPASSCWDPALLTQASLTPELHKKVAPHNFNWEVPFEVYLKEEEVSTMAITLSTQGYFLHSELLNLGPVDGLCRVCELLYLYANICLHMCHSSGNWACKKHCELLSSVHPPEDKASTRGTARMRGPESLDHTVL